MTSHSRVALEERGKHRAILVGGAATTSARDEPLELPVVPAATAEGELAALDGVDPAALDDVPEPPEFPLIDADDDRS